MLVLKRLIKLEHDGPTPNTPLGRRRWRLEVDELRLKTFQLVQVSRKRFLTNPHDE